MNDSALPHPAPRDLRFHKMHGLGNDFVIVDQRAQPAAWPTALVRALADRQCGVGFDQLVLIDADARGDVDGGADARLTFLNADGTPSAACGNGTRCVARILMDDGGRDRVVLRTARGPLAACRTEGGVTVNMGAPVLSWAEIPLAREVDTLHLPLPGDPAATGMGNPHCTFFVPDAKAVDIAALGAAHEAHPLFPDRTNVQAAQVTGRDRLRVRVWERGVGLTRASGSSSCAVAVAAARRGLTGRRVRVDLDGGTLDIDWRDDGVWMTGPTAHVFDGALTAAFIADALAGTGA